MPRMPSVRSICRSDDANASSTYTGKTDSVCYRQAQSGSQRKALYGTIPMTHGTDNNDVADKVCL